MIPPPDSDGLDGWADPIPPSLHAAARPIAAEPVAGPGEELPRMTLRQGLIGTEAQLRWAEDVLPELRARAARHPALA